MTFTQPVSMKVTQKQYEEDLRAPLLAMGYKEDDFLLNETWPILTTNMNGINNEVGAIIMERRDSISRYYINHYNPELFLALAAMTDRLTGIVGEYWKCSEKIYKFSPPIQTWWWSNALKATKEDIINHFLSTQQNKQPMNTQAIKRSHFKEIIDVACESWQEKLTNIAIKSDPLSEYIELKDQFVTEMFKAATINSQGVNQETILCKYLKKPKEQQDKNPFKKSLTPKALDSFNRVLFGRDIMGINNFTCLEMDRKDLQNRSIYVSSEVKVITHDTDLGGTLIELQYK